jgi:tetratricopeptide (TPR) repeat protein
MKRMVVLAAVLALVGGVARAQGSDCSAKDHYDRATAAYGLGRFGDAALEFEKSYECKPQAALLWDAAQAHRQAGNRQRAIALLQNYLHVYGWQAENGTDVRHVIAELQAQPEAEKRPAVAPAPSAPENALVAAAPPPRKKKPVYKRAWFWGAVAGGAAIAAASIALGVVYGTTTRNPTATLGTWAY